MSRERFLAGPGAACVLLAALAGCAAPPAAPSAAAEPRQIVTLAPPPAVPPREAGAAAATVPANPAQMLTDAIGYAERVRALPAAELGLEIQRLGQGGYAPLRATQLALALGQSRNAANAARAQLLLQRVVADGAPDAQPLQPLARLLLAQIAEQRRADEQAERQAQQLRDAQRRIDQLNERLEAVRAIERSLPGPATRERHRP